MWGKVSGKSQDPAEDIACREKDRKKTPAILRPVFLGASSHIFTPNHAKTFQRKQTKSCGPSDPQTYLAKHRLPQPTASGEFTRSTD